MTTKKNSVLNRPPAGPHVIIEKSGKIECFKGRIHEVATLDDLRELQQKTGKEIVAVVPYCRIRERKGYEAPGDPENPDPILALVVENITKSTRDDIENTLLGTGVTQSEVNLKDSIKPTVSDQNFTTQVQSLKDHEIAKGNASQVILSRAFEGKIKSDLSAGIPHICYERLLRQKGQYMTVLFTDGEDRTFVGATPERHLEITADGKVLMNPIAGTMRKGDFGDFAERLLGHDDKIGFLDDKKEINEPYQILDEELKMMAKNCYKGGTITGPFLREPGAVIHTEYLLVGEHDEFASPIDSFRNRLQAPTVVGSPHQSASRIIAQYEAVSRGYYGGEFVILRPDGSLDSSIIIRTAAIKKDGSFSVQAGAGIVEYSIPEKETDETLAKANGFLDVLTKSYHIIPYTSYLDRLSEKQKLAFNEKLAKRNEHLSRFHFEDQSCKPREELLKNKKIIVINDEDDFAVMIGHMASHMGAQVKLVDTFDDTDFTDTDAVIIGPGPGDISDHANPRMHALKNIMKNLVGKKPILGVCLGHQAIAKALGIPVEVQEKPTQGQQRKINLFGENEQYLGFYNSFSPLNKNVPEEVETCLDENGRIIAMRSKGMIGVQFHPESVMTENGYELLKRYMLELTN